MPMLRTQLYHLIARHALAFILGAGVGAIAGSFAAGLMLARILL